MQNNDNHKRSTLWMVALVMALLVPATASAQDDKEELAVEATAVKQTPRKTLEGEKQTGPTDLLVLEKQAESRKKLDAAIVKLKELLKVTPKSNPQRAEFLFNLSELYWEKSKSYEQEAFAKQDECFGFEDRGDEQGAKRCRLTMKDMLNESKRLREESVQLYVDIIQNYPDFAELDSVLYYLGANLMEVGKREQSLEIFKRLINQYPQSRFVPNVLLAFGDFYFDTDDMASALKAYKEVKKYPKSPVYAYARYKEAWCYFNLEGKDKALDTFLQVMDIAKKSKHQTAGGLIKQTRKDIVLTYSFIGAPDKAIPFFKKISGDKEEYLGMGERLAVLYADKGKPLESTEIYRELIKLNKDSFKTIEYQYEVVRNTTTMNSYSQAVVKEIVSLLKLVQYADAGKFKDVDKERYPRLRTRVEELVRGWATTYHREAQKTKNPDLYAMAYFLYKFYLETYPKGPKAYQMTFFYGELLYRLQKWEEAAQAYENATVIEPEGKYTNEAVHALVLSYFKIVNLSEEKADLQEDSQAMLDEATCEETEDNKCEKKKVEVPKPKEIPELNQKLLNACKKYVELNPKGDRIVDVKYTMARTYYDYDHHKEASDAFKDIAYSHPDHRLSVIAANLHLDSLNIQQDFAGLHAAVLEYLEKQPIKDEAFIEDITALNASIRFKKCTILDEEEKWKEAALCFVAYFRDFPESEHVDKALYNAALDFERMKDLGKAIQVRIFLLKFRPESELAPKSLFNIGANYHALAVYSEAAKYYELYAATYPKREKAEVALADASTFRQGLGQLDKAVENYEKYLENYGTRDREKSADVYFQIAKIYEDQGKKKEAFDQYNNYIRKYGKKGPPDRMVQAHVKVGLYFWDRKGSANRKDALKWFKKTLKTFESYPKAEQEKMGIGRDAAAQARFMIGEDVFEEMAKIKIDSKDEKELKKRLQKKFKVAEEAQKIFEQVIGYARPDWAIAALYRIGAGFQDFAENIRSSPPPPRLTYDQKEIYRGILEDQAVIIEEKAVDAYKRALDVAKEYSWFNDYSKKAEIQLAQLRPKEYRKPSELRAEPDHLSHGFSRVQFIEAVEDEDRLTDLNASGPAEAPPQSEPTSMR